VESVVNQFFNNEQLTMAEKWCSRRRGMRSEHSCYL